MRATRNPPKKEKPRPRVGAHVSPFPKYHTFHPTPPFPCALSVNTNHKAAPRHTRLEPVAAVFRPRSLYQFQLHMKLSWPGPRIVFRKKHALSSLDNPVEGLPCRR